MASTTDPVRREVRALARLAAPVAITQLGYMLLGVVDTMMVGHVSADAVAAAALGNTWMMVVQMFAMGVIFGIDPIVSQAHGARRGGRAGLALQQGFVIAFLVGIPTGLSWLVTRQGLELLGQSPELAAMAHGYVLANLPGLLPFLGFVALRSYLQGRGIVQPAMWIALATNALNVFANWVLIYGNLGAPALGLDGSGWATSLSRGFMLAALAGWVLAARLHEGAWEGWSRRAFERAGLAQVLHLGLPTGLQLTLEIWSFHVITLWAGWLGDVELASHAVVLNMASLTFMVPLGVAIGASTRVGNLIGAGSYGDAQRSAWIAFGLAATTMAVFATLFVLLRHELPRLYTRDAGVVGLAAVILPIGAAFQISDGVQVVGSGILRGMGRTRPAAFFNLIAYWGLGLPVGWVLAFRLDLGLAGLWWGLFAGLTVVAGMLVAWVRVRGPARMGVELRLDSE